MSGRMEVRRPVEIEGGDEGLMEERREREEEEERKLRSERGRGDEGGTMSRSDE